MNPPSLFKNAPIKAKLICLCLLSAGAAWASAFVVLAGQHWLAAPADSAQDLTAWLAALSGGLGMAWLLASKLHPSITQAIGQLIDLLEGAANENGHALHMSDGKDELAKLAQGLNSLLAQRQALDHALAQCRQQDLEELVARRTAQLYESEEKFRTISASAQDAIIMMDDNGRITYWNAAAETIFGYPAAEALGQNLHPLLTPERFHECAQTGIERFKRTGTGLAVGKTVELAALRKNGEEFPVELSLSAVRLGGHWHAISILRDITGRKRMEDKLRGSEKQYRSLVDNIPDVVWTSDQAGNTLFISPSIEPTYGYTPQEIYADPSLWFSHIHPDDLGRVEAAFTGLFTNQQMFDIEYRIQKKDGDWLWLHDRALSTYEKNGKWYADGIFTDISKAKRAEAQIRKQQELTTRIIEAIPYVVFWKDRHSRYLGCNAASARLAGFQSAADIIGKTDFDMPWGQEEAIAYRARDQEVMASGVAQLDREETRQRADGGIAHILSSKIPLRDGDGDVMGVLGIYADITERREMEMALRESEERFRKAFQTSAIGMALVGLDGAWLKVNDALCRIVGYPEQELLQKTFQDITHPDDLQTDLNYVAQLLAGQIGHYQMEKRYFHKDGHIVWIRLSGSLINDEQGQPLHFVAQIEDITGAKQAEEQIQKLNAGLEIKVQERTRQLLEAQEELVRKEKLALLGQVAGSVGHELRNPLGVMSNAVYFLRTIQPDADDIIKEYLGIIQDEITVSERIVSDLLDSVRTKPPHPEAVQVAQLLEQCLSKCNIPPDISVTLDIPGNLPALWVDPLQTLQIFRNLISNGVEAMPQGGTLEIRAMANADADNIAISVRDTGVGIDPGQLAKLFQPLFTTKARGIGLGLVVVKNLTQANGGGIDVQSEPGKGSAFLVTLPDASQMGGG